MGSMRFFQIYKVASIIFPLGLRNRLISAELKPIISHTEKSCIASYYREFSTNIKIKIIKLMLVCFNLKIFHFNIRGKMSIIRGDK